MEGENYDVVIIGAGPAGSSAAIRLAQTGKRVLLIDKSKFPREKLCGEFVSPECLRHFEELGVSMQHFAVPNIVDTVFYNRRGNSLAIPNKWLAEVGSFSIGISRSLMDNLLMQRAVECGVKVLTETSFIAAEMSGGNLNGVRLRLRDGEALSIRTLLVVDATGRSRILSKPFDACDRSKKADLVAFKAHVRNAKIAGSACEIYSYPGGYGGCTEIENGRFNLCFIVDAARVRAIGNDPKTVLREVLFKNSRATAVLSDIEVEGNWLAVPIASFGKKSLSPAPGILAIGDSAAFIDPFTGSGIALALESAKLAVDAVTSNLNFEGIYRHYRNRYSASFDRRLSFCKMLRGISKFPCLSDAAISVLGRSNTLSRLFAKGTRSNSSVRNSY